MTGEGGKESAAHDHLTIRHKYKMIVPYPLEVVYDLLKDYDSRYLWDSRDGGREILKIFNVDGKVGQSFIVVLMFEATKSSSGIFGQVGKLFCGNT